MRFGDLFGDRFAVRCEVSEPEQPFEIVEWCIIPVD